MIAQPELGSAQPVGAVSSPLQHSGTAVPAPPIVVTVALKNRRRARPGGAVIAPLQHSYARLSATPAAATRAHYEGWHSGMNVRNTRDRRLDIPESANVGRPEEVLDDTASSSHYMLQSKLQTLKIKLLTGEVSHLFRPYPGLPVIRRCTMCFLVLTWADCCSVSAAADSATTGLDLP